MNKKDTISPSSNTGITGIYTQQKSYVFIAYSKLYFAEDRWRITAAAGTMDINFQFYFEDPVTSVGNFSDYSTKANLCRAAGTTQYIQTYIFRPHRLI